MATSRHASGLEQTLNAGHGVTAEPDRAVVELDRDPAVTAEAPTLTGDIRARLQHIIPTHERGDTPVAASAHWILGDPFTRRKRAHLEASAGARGVEQRGPTRLSDGRRMAIPSWE